MNTEPIATQDTAPSFQRPDVILGDTNLAERVRQMGGVATETDAFLLPIDVHTALGGEPFIPPDHVPLQQEAPKPQPPTQEQLDLLRQIRGPLVK